MKRKEKKIIKDELNKKESERKIDMSQKRRKLEKERNKRNGWRKKWLNNRMFVKKNKDE